MIEATSSDLKMHLADRAKALRFSELIGECAALEARSEEAHLEGNELDERVQARLDAFHECISEISINTLRAYHRGFLRMIETTPENDRQYIRIVRKIDLLALYVSGQRKARDGNHQEY